MNSDFNLTYFADLVAAAKNIGFTTVSLAGTEHFADENMLSDALAVCNSTGVKVWIYFYWCDRSYKLFYPNGSSAQVPDSLVWTPADRFPDNKTQLQQYLSYVENVTNTAKTFNNLVGYVLFYPWGWNYNLTIQENRDDWISRVKRAEYKDALQSIVDKIRRSDSNHLLLVASDDIENTLDLWDALPYDLEAIDGFGFNYYSHKRNSTEESDFKKVYRFYTSQSEHCVRDFLFVTEWGFRTNGTRNHGLADSEEIKQELVEEFATHNWNVPWCYFALHDVPYEQADWGLLSMNLTLKASGETMQEVLNDC
jgi:hypothetical protein